MSDDIRNETVTSFDLGWDYGAQQGRKAIADGTPSDKLDMGPRDQRVPESIEDEGNPQEYIRGLHAGFGDAIGR